METTDSKLPIWDFDWLQSPIPKDKIKQRPGGGGVKLDYIETATAIRRLNEAFNNIWSFECEEVSKSTTCIVVRGRLTVGGIIKEQFGHATLRKSMDLGDSYKTAASDALKKCATLLGLGLELYEQEKKTTTSSSGPASSKF